VRYASATSRTAACDPGGKNEMIVQSIAKVPQVQGNLLELMKELMEGLEIVEKE